MTRALDKATQARNTATVNFMLVSNVDTNAVTRNVCSSQLQLKRREVAMCEPKLDIEHVTWLGVWFVVELVVKRDRRTMSMCEGDQKEVFEYLNPRSVTDNLATAIPTAL